MFAPLFCCTSIVNLNADTVGKNEKAIREYIKSQLEEDYTKDQMTLKEYIDPFTGRKNDRA